MTKKITNLFFLIYQGIFVSRNATCRFEPTCSQYAKTAIDQYGLARGAVLATKRLLSCHPFSKRPLFDPVPGKDLSKEVGQQL